MSARIVLLIGASLSCLSACTSIPEPSDSFSRNGAVLSPAKGIRGKRLSAPPPSPPIVEGAVLHIDQVVFADDAVRAGNITPEQRALVSNALARHACSDLSALFDVVSTGATTSNYRLHMAITNITPTSRVGAVIGNVSGQVAPIGIRPPIGLGSMTVEFELFRPDGTLATAMVWSQKADMASSDATISQIGDAYAFTENASSDFANLVQDRSTRQQVVARARNIMGSKSDEACDAYGKGPGFLAGFVPLPPTMTDKGPKPEISAPSP